MVLLALTQTVTFLFSIKFSHTYNYISVIVSLVLIFSIFAKLVSAFITPLILI